MKQGELLILQGTNQVARAAGCSAPSVTVMMRRLGFQPLALLERSGKTDELWLPCQAAGLAEYLSARRDKLIPRARIEQAICSAKTKAAGIIAKRHQKPATIC